MHSNIWHHSCRKLPHRTCHLQWRETFLQPTKYLVRVLRTYESPWRKLLHIITFHAKNKFILQYLLPCEILWKGRIQWQNARNIYVVSYQTYNESCTLFSTWNGWCDCYIWKSMNCTMHVRLLCDSFARNDSSVFKFVTVTWRPYITCGPIYISQEHKKQNVIRHLTLPSCLDICHTLAKESSDTDSK